MDPQIFFQLNEEDYLGKLFYEPQDVDVLEVCAYERHPTSIRSERIVESRVESWLNTLLGSGTHTTNEPIRTALRLVLGAPATAYPADSPIRFPDDYAEIRSPRIVPFSQSLFELMITKFNLPRATSWLCYTDTGHFQRYRLGNGPESNHVAEQIGLTMRRSSRGILAIDMALSLSHDPSTGVTYALLLGHSPRQAAFIKRQIQALAPIAHHPAFLPTLICTYHRSLLQRLSDHAWDELIRVEASSGQSGLRYSPRPPGPCGAEPELTDSDLTNRVLGVIQLSAAWESFTMADMSDAESIRELLAYGNGLVPLHQRGKRCEEDDILSEQLRLLDCKARSILSRLQLTKQRAQAQQNAVRATSCRADLSGPVLPSPSALTAPDLQLHRDKGQRDEQGSSLRFSTNCSSKPA